MNKKQWDKLPIGTVLVNASEAFDFIDVKISKERTICVSDLKPWSNLDFVGYIDYKDCSFPFIAPKWIQELFEVKW